MDLARQGRDITQRHPWLPRAVIAIRPPVMGPAALRYMDYFLGLLGGTGAGHRGQDGGCSAMVNGFAVSYGGMQAALAEDRTRTGVTAEQQAAAQVSQLVAAAASGRYPNLTAALAAPAPPGAGRGRDLRLLRPPPDRRVPARRCVRTVMARG